VAVAQLIFNAMSLNDMLRGLMDVEQEIALRIRSSIRDHLALLADPAQQRQYERDVPNAVVSAELVCIWFDDIYHPESPDHHRAFTSAEMAALEDFNTLFDDVTRRLGPIYDLTELQAHGDWSRVCQAAGEVLRGIPAELPKVDAPVKLTGK